MTYRSDQRARQDRRLALERSLRRIDEELSHLEPLQRERRTVYRELDALRRDEASARARASLPLLRRVTVTTPCREKWSKMTGDDKVRHCARCDKNVFNLSAMEPDEASAVLDRPDVCVRFFRRSDGTIVSGECAGGAARRKWTGRAFGVAALSLVAAAIGVGGNSCEATMGKPAVHDDPYEEVAGGLEAAPLDPGETPVEAYLPVPEPDTESR